MTNGSVPVFRLAGPDDLARLEKLEQLEQAYPWTRDTLASHLGSRRYRVGILESAADLIGYFSALSVADECSLLNLLVARDFRGQGFGRMLLEKMLDLARAEAAETVFLEVRAGNEPAIALYHAAGFVETGVRKAYYPSAAGREDAVIMALMLDNA